MKWLKYSFAFFIAFSVDIKVHAYRVSLPIQSEVTMLPEKCWEQKKLISCVIKTKSGRRSIVHFDDVEISMGSNTIIERVDGKINLVKGKFFLQTEEPVQVGSEYGVIDLALGKYWLERDEKKITVAVVEGGATLKMRGQSESIKVYEGFSNYLSEIRNGESTTGIPSQIFWQSVLPKLAEVYFGKKENFQAMVKELFEKIEEAVKTASIMHQKMVDREIASIEEKKARQREYQRKVEAENRELRKLFREKNFLE